MQDPFKLQPYQQDLVDKLKGYKPGEMMIITSGRQTGKSYMNKIIEEYQNLMAVPYKQLSQATVDGEKWYTVSGQKHVCEWIRTQDEKCWHEHIDQDWYVSFSTFDIHEKIYTMLGMKF